MPFALSRICILRVAASVSMLVLLSVLPAFAQSTDVRFPTAVSNSEIVGSVPARDIGDARLTDHFYTFNGLPGDILVTIESKNLNGDFDVFTAAELRPLLKVSVYAETASAVTKNIYLRKPESLILRVEARTPNDDEGTYRIRFTGSFAPLENGASAADAGTPKEGTSQLPRAGDRKTTRVSSSGARIEETVTEVAAAPTPEPSPAAPKEDTPAITKTPPPRTLRIRRPPVRATAKPAAKPAEQTAKTDNASEDGSKPPKDDTSDTSKSASEESAKTEPPVVANKRPTPRRPAPKPARGTPRIPKPESTAENGRLIIEVKGGARIEYLMSTVTRLTVENGEIVIVSDDGYTKRVPLTEVLRMSIAP